MENLRLGDTIRSVPWYQSKEQRASGLKHIQGSPQQSLVVSVHYREQAWTDDRPAYLYLGKYV